MANEINRARLRVTLDEIGTLLRDGRYSELEKSAPGSRVSAEEIARAIEQYGRRVLGIDASSASVVPHSDTSGWSVWVDLLTAEEGRSDLAVMMTLFDTPPPGTYRVHIDDIRVP